MAGFAVVIDISGEGRHDTDFNSFLQLVADYKSLEKPTDCAYGRHCIGAKLDSPASLHTGITVDPETGSWLIAAGTVVDTYHVASDGNLRLILQEYLTHGETVLQRCDGLFALVIYNGLTQSVAVISDPFGYFSVFHGSRNDQMFVSTSALAVAEAIRSEPSDIGVNCFLRTGKVFGGMTLWRDVKRLCPGTVLEFSDGAMRESTYWVPTVDESITKLSFADSIEASMQVLQGVFKRNLEREGKVWMDLTGGFDTRLMAMFLERAGIPFKANSVGPAEHPDVRIAHAIAHKMGWEYQNFDFPSIWPQECPHHLRDVLGRGDAHLNVLLLTQPLWTHRQKADQYTTLLNGLGGEMWRGPLWWPEGTTLGKSTLVNYERQLWSLMHPVAASVFGSDSSSQVKEEIKSQFKGIGDRYPDALNTLRLDCIWAYRETAHVGAWASAASGLLRTIPILFSKDIVTHVISLDYRWKTKNQLVRYMLERYSPTLADIEVEGRGPAMPMRITNFYRFVPSKIISCRKTINKLGEITLGKSFWPTKSCESYSRVEWRQEILEFAEAEGLFHPSEMHSGNLYRSDQLRSFLSQAQTKGFHHDEFLGRIITVEMALRAVGAAIN
jgi:hypothetical protein